MGISTLACGLGYSTRRRKMPHVHLVPLNVGCEGRQIPPDLVVKFQAVDIVEVIELSWSDEAHPKVV
jgi:hypothetical protein